MNLECFNNISLENRMKKNVSKCNSAKCHYFKPHIVSIKSREILTFLNTLTSFDEKIKMLEMFQDILFESIKPIYKNYAPNLIYTFLDEVHLVFFYNDDGNYIYDGNITKTITALTSSISINVFRELQKRGIELDFKFSSQFVEFDKDYETLNYLVWRQNDCKRNIVTLLHKCLHSDLFLENDIDLNTKLDKLKNDIDEILKADIEISLLHLLRGNIIKKHQQIQNETRVTRNIIHIEHFLLADNFDKTFEKYIKNKIVNK